MNQKTILTILFTIILNFSLVSQKVGLVMSGGGAAGMAHVGVIKALEENGIPIDYIAGTSAGALVGSFYATGKSPKEIEEMIKSPMMLDMSKGKTNEYYKYFFKEKEPQAKIIDFNFDGKFSLTKVFPLNITDPSLIDFFQIENFTNPSELANGNFDSLFIPYRCVASDIDKNVAYICRNGNLSQAVRSSMSFPFYLPAITIDDKIYLDGGLYNNFPADVMYEDFMPDVIIGSSVSSERKTPKKDDIVSQLRSMLQTKSNFSLACKEGIIINSPVDDIGTFDFEDRIEAMNRGYNETIKNMDSIKSLINRRIDSNLLQKKREKYFKKINKEIIINNIHVIGVSKIEEKYIRSVLKDRNKSVTIEELKRRYFKLILDDKIEFIFPLIKKNKNDEFYTLHLDIRKKPMFNLRIGGNFSSRSVNTGYAGFDYRLIGSFFATTPSLNTYFGRFYNSLDLSARTDFPLDFPFYVEPFVTYNRWDYFRSFSYFFEDTKPSFLVKNQAFFGGTIGFPAKNNARFKFTYKNGFLNHEYYQTSNFTSVDTSDRTEFYFDNISLDYEYNSTDAYYLSKKGRQVKLSGSYISGGEINFAGSTSSLPNDTVVRISHNYFLFQGKYEEFFDLGLNYKLGIQLEGVHTTQKFFSNYTANALVMPQYNPTQESMTLFIDNYTARTYGAIGIKNIFPITSSIDFRVEGYLFQPYRNIISDINKKAITSDGFENTKRYYTLSSALVFNSPLGPAVARVNYMDHRRDKFSFMINFNYTLFNRKAINW